MVDTWVVRYAQGATQEVACMCVDVLYQRVPRKRAKRGTGERTKNGRKRDRQGQTTRVEEDREARKRQRVAIKRERDTSVSGVREIEGEEDGREQEHSARRIHSRGNK